MLNDLKMEINLCTSCSLEKIRKNPIMGSGNINGKILFLMENISETEDKKGELLSDERGEYFNRFLEYSKLDLSKCYFTTLNKCSSGGNLIEDKQIDKCFDYFIGQVAIMKPEYIVAVGEKVIKKLIGSNEDIHKMVGKTYNYMGDIKIIPIYNKSYLLKATDKEKWKLIKIFEKLNLEIQNL